MTPTERQRIEKEADEYAAKIASELDENAGKTLLKIYAIADYTAGATAEHDKARNQAINDAIKNLNESFAFGSINLERHDWDEINKILESLKTKL